MKMREAVVATSDPYITAMRALCLRFANRSSHCLSSIQFAPVRIFFWRVTLPACLIGITILALLSLDSPFPSCVLAATIQVELTCGSLYYSCSCIWDRSDSESRSSHSPTLVVHVHLLHSIRLAVAGGWCWFRVREKYCWLMLAKVR